MIEEYLPRIPENLKKRASKRICSFLHASFTLIFFSLSGTKRDDPRNSPIWCQKEKEIQKKPKEHAGLLFHFYCRPSFLSLFLHQALGETILEIPISSAKNPKKIVNQKSKKSTQAYFSVPISVPGSYLHFFIRRWARQFSKYPYLAPKIQKKFIN